MSYFHQFKKLSILYLFFCIMASADNPKINEITENQFLNSLSRCGDNETSEVFDNLGINWEGSHLKPSEKIKEIKNNLFILKNDIYGMERVVDGDLKDCEVEKAKVESNMSYKIAFARLKDQKFLSCRIVYSDSSYGYTNFNEILNDPKKFGPLVKASVITSDFQTSNYLYKNRPVLNLSFMSSKNILDKVSLQTPSFTSLVSSVPVKSLDCLFDDYSNNGSSPDKIIREFSQVFNAQQINARMDSLKQIKSKVIEKRNEIEASIKIPKNILRHPDVIAMVNRNYCSEESMVHRH